MAIKDDRRTGSLVEEPSAADTASNGGEATTPAAPYLGRSVKVVGPWKSVDAAGTPHEKNRRGELGKPLFNWYVNRISNDPLGRTAFPLSSADRRNTLQGAVSQAPRGAVNPEKTTVTDPRTLTRHIKRVARYFGADVVGIAAVHPSMLYSGPRNPDYDDSKKGAGEGAGRTQTSADVAEKLPFAISLSTAWDYNMIQAHRHHVGDHAYHFSQARLQLIYANLAAYVRELGYEVVQNRAQPMPTALAAGIGELGRHGMLISEKFGSRIHLGDPFLTNMPLVADKPIDIGVEDFCKICRKCATACPTNSITMEDKVVHNGVEKYKINWETCYRLRAYVMDFWEICLSCVTVCPYTKPNTWWRTLAVQSLKRTPIALRSLVVRPLKLLDDKIWGTVPRKRVRWLNYDSGIMPVLKKRDAANGTADKVPEKPPDPKSKVGYYYPLKENTRRFEILRERAGRSK